jgi:hypothetical protein
MSVSDSHILNPLWFTEVKRDVFSQNGEDGIVEKIFELIGTTNSFAIECGALNGVKDSGTRNLTINHDWKALLIEGDETPFEKLVQNYKENASVNCVNAFITFTGETALDGLFEKFNVPQVPDLFVLDIDGNEYHVWEALTKFSPRVMVVEFNPTIPNDVEFIQPKDMSVQQGSSLLALTKLATQKGYTLVAVTYVNAFFVKTSEAEPFVQLSGTVDTVRPHNPHETKLFQLYDGTLKISGNTQLLWHKKPIDEEKLQVLSKSERVFLNGINSNAFVRNLKHKARKSSLYPLIRWARQHPVVRSIIK